MSVKIMKNILPVFIGLSLMACATSKVIQVEEQKTEPRPPHAGPVQVFQSKDAVESEYTEIAVLRFEGNEGDKGILLPGFKDQAAQLGADAIVMLPEEDKLLFKGGTSERKTIYRALAIDLEE